MDSRPANMAHAAIRGTFWTYISYYSGRLMVFLSTVILARLLTQEDFGVAGYAVTVISFLDVLSDLGVGAALIYHRDDPGTADTAFWLSVLVGVTLFAVSWLSAPLAGAFFGDPRAVPVTQVLALTFPISALSNVHESLLAKSLAFRRKFIPDVVQMTSKGIVSIALAALGFGAWSLVFGVIAGRVVAVIAYWRAFPWRPSFHFVVHLARSLLRYGVSMVWASIVSIVLLNADYLLVGRYLGAVALGVYTVAFRLPELLILQFCRSIAQVIFPLYSKMQDDPRALQRGFLTTMRYVAMVTVPLSLGMALVAEPLVLTIFTRKWTEAIPVVRAIAIYCLFLSLAYNAGDAYKAQGRLSILTRLLLVRTVMLLPALYWAVTGPATITAVGWTHAIVACLGGALSLFVAGRMLDAPFKTVMATLGPAMLCGALMCVAVVAALSLSTASTPLVQLVASVGIGSITYIAALWLLQRDLVLVAGSTLRTALARR